LLIYAYSLSSALNRCDIVNSIDYAEFFTGFNLAGERYLMIDVGAGKEMADARIKCAFGMLIRKILMVSLLPHFSLLE
jgi:hypothetical protein